MEQQQADTPSKKASKGATAAKTTSSNKPERQSAGYQVETGVPVPPRKYSRQSKYPFAEMLPGQSVLIKGKTYSAVIGVLRQHKAKGKSFTVRTTEEGIRVWRD
jgi:hypothetical protein